MSNKKSLAANGSAAIFGALAIELINNLDPKYQDIATYAVPAITLSLAFVFNLLANITTMSLTEMLATRSSKKYFDELRLQIADPLVKPNKKEELTQEYNDALEATLAMKKGTFSLLTSAHEKARGQAESTIKKGVK